MLRLGYDVLLIEGTGHWVKGNETELCQARTLSPQQLTKCCAGVKSPYLPMNEGATRQPVASGAGSVRDGGEG